MPGTWSSQPRPPAPPPVDFFSSPPFLYFRDGGPVEVEAQPWRAAPGPQLGFPAAEPG